MKINSWSVVKSPTGLSLRHIKNSKINHNGEVCVSVLGDLLVVSVYADGEDTALAHLRLDTNTLKPRVVKPKKGTSK